MAHGEFVIFVEGGSESECIWTEVSTCGTDSIGDFQGMVGADELAATGAGTFVGGELYCFGHNGRDFYDELFYFTLLSAVEVAIAVRALIKRHIDCLVDMVRRFAI